MYRCICINKTDMRVSFSNSKAESGVQVEISEEERNYSVIAIPGFKE